MQKSVFERIEQFNEQVVGVQTGFGPPPRGMTPDLAKWLLSALEEETTEFFEAANAIEQFDALVDLCVFSIGGLLRMGLSASQVEQGFHAVMDANFQKKAGSQDKRPGAADAVKPEGFVGPEKRLADIMWGSN